MADPLPTGHQTRRGVLATTTRMMLGAVASALVASGGAAANPFDADGLGPRQAERIGQVCRQVMGFEPGETQFDSCAGSLSREYKGRLQASALIAARQACLVRGLPVGSAGLAECELQAPRSMPAAELPEPAPAAARARTSFFQATPREAFHRAQSACAALGLEPVSDAFASCVANVNSSAQPETPEG